MGMMKQGEAVSDTVGKSLVGVPVRSYQMVIPTERYCVYAHRHHDTIFYIGQGRLGRPFDVNSRNGRWWQYVEEIGSYTIEILGYFPTMAEAKREEERLLRLIEPICNITGKGTLIADDITSATTPRPNTPEERAAVMQIVTLQKTAKALEEDYAFILETNTALLQRNAELSQRQQERDQRKQRLVFGCTWREWRLVLLVSTLTNILIGFS